MIENVTNLSSTPALSDPFMPVGAIIVGAIIAGLVGIATNRVNQYFNMRSTKKYTSKALLSEIEANQNRLRPLVNVIKVWDNEGDKDTMKNSHFPNEIRFDKTIYSSLSDKIGLLDSKSRDKVVKYYAKIKLAEEQYKKLELIHRSSLSVSDLRNLKIKEAYNKRIGVTSSDPIEWDEMEGCFTNAEEAYDTGKELIESLKGQT